MTAPKIVTVAVGKIDPDPDQPRKDFPAHYIAQLARSIVKRGLIQPITVRPNGKRYMIVAGECRWRAHVHAKLDVIKAIVEAVDAREANLRAIVENLQRRDMNPIEEANAFKTLLDRNYRLTEIVEELGLASPSIVRQRLDLLDLTPDIQALVSSGNLSVIMAWGVAQAPTEHQARIIQQINQGRLRTAEQVKQIGMALRDAAAQQDAFGELPKASKADIVAVSRLEAKIEAIAEMVAEGFKDGECIAARRVCPARLITMAEKLGLIRKHALAMEHDLRRVAMQTELLESAS